MKRVIPEGIKPYVTHFRRFPDTDYYMTKFDGSDLGTPPEAKGGITEVVLLDKEGNIASIGISRCSERDPFNKKIGRDIALGRALKYLEAR